MFNTGLTPSKTFHKIKVLSRAVSRYRITPKRCSHRRQLLVTFGCRALLWDNYRHIYMQLWYKTQTFLRDSLIRSHAVQNDAAGCRTDGRGFQP